MRAGELLAARNVGLLSALSKNEGKRFYLAMHPAKMLHPIGGNWKQWQFVLQIPVQILAMGISSFAFLCRFCSLYHTMIGIHRPILPRAV